MSKQPKQPPGDCGFCYGAWNGLDRWFMQPCVCKRRCVEPACEAGKPGRAPEEGSQ